MKKRAIILSVVSSLLMLSVPCFAVQWPPAPADIPRTVLEPSTLAIAEKMMKTSMGAITSAGLRILGVTFSVSLISGIFLRLLLDKLNLYNGVWKREFQRKVKALDRRMHLDSIVDDRVAEMEINMLAKNRFRLRNPMADLNEKIYQRELSFQAAQAIRQRHPDRDLEESIQRREVAAAANIEFTRRNPVLSMESKVANRESSFVAEGMFRYRNPTYTVLRQVDNRYISDEAAEQYRRSFPERARRSRRHRR